MDTTFDPGLLADDLREVNGVYADLFRALSRDRWDQPARRGVEEWTLRETIAHLCALKGDGLQSVRHALNGETYTFRGLESRYDLESYNRKGIDDHLGTSVEVLCKEFLRVHGEAADLAGALDPAMA